jgi:hypothetical protein
VKRVSAFDQSRAYGALRTALISYGVAAFTYLFARAGATDEAKAIGVGGSASTFVLSGLALQVLLIVGRLVIKRLATDRDIAAQAFLILELLVDGVTVLLFALATFGAILHAPEQF